MMKWAFVDYENVNSLDLVNLNDFEWVILFCGPKDKNLTVDLNSIESGKSPRLEIIRLDKSAKNNLDFHLALYLGRYHETVEEGVEFSVVSNDAGFDGIISHLKKMGRKCERVKDMEVAEKVVKKVTKKTAAKKIAKKTTKKVVKKAASKIVKPKLNSSASENALRSALQAFEKHPANSWPKTKIKLGHWLEDKVKLSVEHARELITSMVREDHIFIGNEKIIYNLDLSKVID